MDSERPRIAGFYGVFSLKWMPMISQRTGCEQFQPVVSGFRAVCAHDDVGKVSESLVSMAVSMLTLYAAAAAAADADACIKNHVSRQSMSKQSAVISPAITFIEIRVSW